jgi:topoisomerase-4 subunit B
MVQSSYTETDIKVLEGLEAVRRRPGMYIGSTGSRGLHHLVFEIVDNAVDEALAGFCTKIDVRIDDGEVITVKDDGRGIPTGMHPTGLPTPEVIFTKLHAGGKFDNTTYKVSGGLHGVGASVVNALSSFFEVEIRRDGVVHKQLYQNGARTIGKLLPVGTCASSGTTIRFRPDDETFKVVKFERQVLARRLQELAFLNAGLRLSLVDARESPQWRESWQYDGGLKAFVQYLNEGRAPLHDLIYFKDSEDGIDVEVALQYHDGYSETLHSFVNCINTIEGGQHETGFKTAHTRLMNEYARRYGVWKKKENLSGEDLREGMVAALNLRMPETEFEGQTKTKLGNPEARAAVEAVTARQLSTFLEEHPDAARSILEKASRAQGAREAARKARDLARKGKEAVSRTSLGGKLTRATSRNPEETELVIVEGDSAGGSAKQGRDRRIQAILPLRGKPLNTERAQLAKVLQNKEFLAIIQAMGAGIGNDFDLAEARYGRILILADADDDGAHIRCLLLTFFYRFMRPYVMAGRVFIAQPPLFKVERKGAKGGVVYAWSIEEMQAALRRFGKGATVQRYKGLGEMTAQQLWDTTLDPEKRTLLRVTLDDAAAADHQVSVLMGDSAELRKAWISQNVAFGVDPLAAVRSEQKPAGAGEAA